MKTTIFNRIVTNENSFTELFRNFLRFKAFRQSFLGLIEIELDSSKIDYDDFDSQFSITRFGRPDLALITDDIEILFEIKVYNTSLTENQPKGYYTYLKEDSKARAKGLILIIPENYYDLKTYNANLESVKKDTDNIFTQVIHWETISKLITDNELEITSPLFAEYSEFIVDWFQLRTIFYDSLNTFTMFGKRFPESLKKTMEIIDSQYNRFGNQGYNLKWTKEKHFSEYGFYFEMPDDNDALFFGIWLTYWETSGKPVCVALKSQSSEVIKAFESGVSSCELYQPKRHGDWLVAYIDEQTLMEEECGQKISKTISVILEKLNIQASKGN